ncbi:MAG TPA: hydroxysqualene dehydroxylase HpnE, partial [Ramlibacter sp.]|nr:hydroxysqualene dehydroxylase HpnE [Ramlibacter sp.]
AIVGGGWAGLAAAVAATQRGHRVDLFEAARFLGGRARTLEVRMPDGATVALDNGQHILIGAYVQTLRLMEAVGVDLGAALLRLPLVLRDAQGQGIALPHWPAPLDAMAGILGARGWSWSDKLSLLRSSLRWQATGFRCAPECTVADLCRGLRPRVREQLIEPLCVAALNTPAARASGQVFLRVLKDSLFGRGHGRYGGSNLLLPRQDLGRVFPHAAQGWLQQHGAQVQLGERLDSLVPLQQQGFDEIILAVPALEAARLVESGGVAAPAWCAQARALCYEAIATTYVTGGPRLPFPMLALAGGPAQFVFDRGQLGGPAGLLAFVASASPAGREEVERQVLAQAAALGWPVQALQTVVEKRATFACTPGLQRPPMHIAPHLWACGDYVDGPYPATLEGAVRAGLAVVSAFR